MKEEWAYIDGFPEYMISNLGRVVNLKYQWMLKPQATDRGYMKVMLRRDRKSHQHYVHQLVGVGFLKDFRRGMRISHIDDDLSNNEVKNLKRMVGPTRGEIVYDSPRMHARRLRIIQTGEVFRTAYDCARYIGGNASSIYRVLNGYRETHLGYTFEYVDTETEIHD